MLRPLRAHLLFLVLATLFLALAGLTNGAPLHNSHQSSITRRRGQGAFQGPTTVQTSKTTISKFGPIIEDCKITLTPELGPNREDLVREDRFCTVTLNANPSVLPPGIDSNGNNNDDGSRSDVPPDSQTGNGGSSSTGGDPSGTAPLGNDGSLPPSSSPPPPGSSQDGSQGSPSSSDNGQSSPNGNAPSSAPGSGSSPTQGSSSSGSSASNGGASASPTAPPGSPATPAPTNQSNGNPTPTSGGSTDSGQGNSGQGNSGQGTSGQGTSTSASAAAEQSSTGTPFSLPGQKLQVLPIGLGVFAGISVIALIVVGLVTYERTKYRKAFRQRRLAEQGQTPGYGGMSERPA